jgi:hypothetical protein
MNKGVKIALFFVFCLILATPFIFSFTELNSKINLKGTVELAEKPVLKKAEWLSGNFQAKYEKYMNDNIGFRPFFVRIRNQVLFSLFNKMSAVYVIRGKENHLYETNYIRAYNGADFIGVDSIYYKSLQIKELQDSLQQYETDLIICLAAGKGSFYPEYFPDEYKLPPTDSTNQKFYIKAFEKLGVNYLDFNKWFVEMKDTSRCCLYPKYGIHWSEYGMLLATDSLIAYIENKRGVDLPDLKISNYKVTKKLNNTDYDIADGLNLLFKLPVDPMCYPEVSWESPAGKDSTKVVVIADSFYWNMYGTGVWHQSFRPGGFWYYNRLVYPDSFEQQLEVKDLNLRQAIKNTDVFIVMVTEANLPKFPWGFVKNTLAAFSPDYNATYFEKRMEEANYQKELQNHIFVIRNNENWMKTIREKAGKQGISVDSMVVRDAIWIMEQKKEKDK